MPFPIANAYGNGVVLATSTATGAYASGVEQKIDVALGRPMLEALADIANAFHLRKTDLTDTNGQYALRLTDGGSTTYNLEETWYQQALREGDSVVLESV
jgi:hypothetical protein